MPKTQPKPFSNHVKDLTGQRFGRLKVISFSHLNKWRSACWKCTCRCGKISIVQGCHLQSRKTVSCGCFNREATRKREYKHGYSSRGTLSVEYTCWICMRCRCHNPKHRDYKWYGARGISVCKRWRDSFPNFLADMGFKPSSDLSLDRIDNDGNYKPGNCRWATAKQQANNQRSRARKPTD